MAKTTNTNESSVQLFKEYFLLTRLSGDLQLALLFARPAGKKKTLSKAKLDLAIETLSKRAQELGLDRERFQSFVTVKARELLAGKLSPNEPDSSNDYSDSLAEQIRNIPNTIGKALAAMRGLIQCNTYMPDQIYDAMVLLDKHVSPVDIRRVVHQWKTEAAGAQGGKRDAARSPATGIFWDSRHSHDTIDAISRYRFREHFAFGEFQSAFDHVEWIFATSLLEGSSGVEARMLPFWGDMEIGGVAYNLWLASRSRDLPNRIREFVNITLRRIATAQFEDGGFTDYLQSEESGADPGSGRKRHRLVPDVRITAICSLVLLKLAISQPLRDKGVLGARWLLENQNPDGSWRDRTNRRPRRDSNGDLFVTCLSVEALARSGIPKVDHSIESGLEWIKQQQNDMGWWDDEVFPFPFLTVLILELFENRVHYSAPLDHYLSMSKGLLERSIQLSLEENSNSYRLALIAAHHGIEVFLYSLLSHHTVNVRIFDEQNQTIGMRKALSALKAHLRRKERLGRNEDLQYGSDLARLAHLRDEVAHKGIDISVKDCRPLVESAVRFASKYGQEILGYDIWA
jgi:hypothetical protein